METWLIVAFPCKCSVLFLVHGFFVFVLVAVQGSGNEALAHGFADLFVQIVEDFGVVSQILHRGVAALADAVTVVGEPGTGLLDEVALHGDIQQAACL